MKGINRILHRLALYTVGILLFITGRIRYKVFMTGLGNPPDTPGIMTTNNHQRDWDIVLIGDAFLRSWRKWKYIDRLSWAGRDDIFVKGYFSTHFEKLSLLIRFFFFHLDLGPILNYLNANPIRPLQLRHLRHLLMDAVKGVGDIPIAELLAKGWEQKFPYLYDLFLEYKRKGKNLRISETYKFRIWRDLNSQVTYYDITEKYRETVRMANITAIKDSLTHFSDLVNNNHMLYFSVEGELTTDGQFKSFRAGLNRIIENCNSVELIPMNLTYDYMHKGRHAVFLNYGAPVALDTNIDKHDLKNVINKHIMELQTGTMTSFLSLAVYKVWKGGKSVIEHYELKEAIQEILEIYRSGRHFYDKRLESAKYFAKRFKQALKWGAKKNLWELAITKASQSRAVLNLEKLKEICQGPWPFVNYLTYAVNQIPPSIIRQYLSVEEERYGKAVHG